MTYVKQGRSPQEVLIMGGEDEVMDGSQQWKGPQDCLAPVVDVKNTPFTPH